MLLGKEVLLQTHGRDRSGRILAEVRLARWHSCDHTLVKKRLVRVVSGICAKEHRTSAAREACTRDEARLMGESDSCAAVGVAKENPLKPRVLEHLRPIFRLGLPSRLLLAGLSWDRGTSLDDEIGGGTLSLRCWFRPAISGDFFLWSAFAHTSFLGFRRCNFQGFHCAFDPRLGDRQHIFEIV